MKVYLPWLQQYFEKPLPDAEAIAHALTFHACEIEEVTGPKGKEVIDVKVLPDRAAYALSHRGIAGELAAILGMPLTKDSFAEVLSEYPTTNRLAVSVEDAARCPRYMAALITGVNVGPSPAWLVEALTAIGQRSINNVVDATNYVMLNIGQPLHAFDAGKLSNKDGVYAIGVRGALEAEPITTLTGEAYQLPEGTLVITDAGTGLPIGIAGVKGGKAAELTEATTDIIIESANFDGTLVRRTSQALKLWTDASLRFQNKPAAELVAYGMKEVLTLIQEIAGGDLVGVTDTYPVPSAPVEVRVSLNRINGLLGSTFTSEEVADALSRLTLPYTVTDDVFTVSPPFVRKDILIPEDVVEEVGRILGYEHVPAVPLSSLPTTPTNDEYVGGERIRDFLAERGWNEISTQSFAAIGDIVLANPLQNDRPYLRASLAANMQEALAKAATAAPRVRGVASAIKLFELGNVFTNTGELRMLSLGCRLASGKSAESLVKEEGEALQGELFGSVPVTQVADVAELNLSGVDVALLGRGYTPQAIRMGGYRPFSVYPFALRDVAVWTPAGTAESEVVNLILQNGGDFLVRIDLFDRFEKDGRISYAFRLVFESMERTLADTDLDPAMEQITTVLNGQKGFEVR